GGKVMIAPVISTGGHDTLIYDPVSDSWSAGGAFVPRRGQDEASWVKLSDESILSADNDGVHAERYVPSQNQWVDEAVIPTSARLYGQGEIGPALLLPNGHAFFLGATGHTAIYTPPTGGAPTGSWATGPDIPMSRVSCD